MEKVRLTIQQCHVKKKKKKKEKKKQTSWKLIEESTNVEGNMRDIVSDKAEGPGGTVNRMRDYA